MSRQQSFGSTTVATFHQHILDTPRTVGNVPAKKPIDLITKFQDGFQKKPMKHKRVANWKIDEIVANLEEFTNYNDTIRGQRVQINEFGYSPYTIEHWSTRIAVIDVETRRILFLAYHPISATTSRLIGRILRSLPKESVERYLYRLKESAPSDVRRLARMARI